MKDKFRKQAFETPFITKPCPYCGYKKPQLQPYQYGDGLLVKCPECWAITPVKQTWLSAVDAWENGEFSEETKMLTEHPRTPESINIDGALTLAEVILADAADHYLFLLKRAKRVKEYERRGVEAEIEYMERAFFLGDSIVKALPVDGQDIINTLRKQAERGRRNHKVVDGYRKENT